MLNTMIKVIMIILIYNILHIPVFYLIIFYIRKQPRHLVEGKILKAAEFKKTEYIKINV